MSTAPTSPAGLPPLGLGTATSAYQIEGAVDADGRGPSIWDTFCAREGTVLDGSSGAVACRSYERWEEDLDLVAGLGIGSYRFSVAWPRVQPQGSGAAEPRGLDHYDRVVDGLLARGIRPAPTLYHWDLPQPLEDAGGWPVRDTALRFADYALLVAERLGDRVDLWTTLNEPWCSAFLGYAAGVHAPGRREPEAAMAAAHHLLLGHGLAARALREQQPGLDVGIVLNLAPVRPEPDTPEGVADLVDAIQNGLWLGALVDGAYPALLTERSSGLREVVQDGDLEAVRGSADWLGVNYYTPLRPGPPGGGTGVGQAADAYPYTRDFGFHPRPPHTAMHWEVDGTGLEDVLTTVHASAPDLPLRVTENGASFPDATRDDAGVVVDEDRITYLREHLAAVDRVRAAGVPVHDYFAWSLLDNFEWGEGYTQTFGLVSVDAETGTRTPKASYAWFREHAAGR